MKNVLYFPRKLNIVNSGYLYSRFNHILSIMIAGAAAYLTYLASDIFNYELVWLDHNGSTNLLIYLLLSLSIIAAIYLLLQSKQIKKLKGTLKTKNGELRAYQDQLIQKCKLAEIGKLTSQIAHDLNQDLTVINLNTMLSIEGLKEENYEQIEHFNNITLKSIERAIRLSKELTNFCRDTTRDRYSLENLDNIVQDLILIIGSKLRKKDIDLIFEMSGNSPYIFCNRIQIEQVIINLLNNAIDAINNTPGKIVLRVYEMHSNVVIEIEDNGIGVEKEDLSKICKEFYTTKNPGEGTGLGLSICNEIISRHSGKLEILSKKGDGSTFRVFLPAYKEAA